MTERAPYERHPSPSIAYITIHIGGLHTFESWCLVLHAGDDTWWKLHMECAVDFSFFEEGDKPLALPFYSCRARCCTGVSIVMMLCDITHHNTAPSGLMGTPSRTHGWTICQSSARPCDNRGVNQSGAIISNSTAWLFFLWGTGTVGRQSVLALWSQVTLSCPGAIWRHKNKKDPAVNVVNLRLPRSTPL